MAIALDTTAKGTTSFSYTATGTNLIMVAFINASSSGISAPSFNGVSLTQIGSEVNNGGGDFLTAWYLINPATGAHTFTATGADNTKVHTYTGAKQSGQPDASNFTNGTTQTVSGSVTTVANNSWVVAFVVCAQNPVASTNFTQRQTDGVTVKKVSGDSNGPATPAGSFNQQMTRDAGSGRWDILQVSIAPAASASVNSNFLPLL